MTIACPSCHRRLRLPASLQDRQVQCPLCGRTFTATADVEPRPERPRAAPASPPRPVPQERLEIDDAPPDAPAEDGEVPCPWCGEFVRREVHRCPHCGRRLLSTREAPFWVRRDCEPHRGATLQALGVASLLLSLLTAPAAALTWASALRMPAGGAFGLVALGLGVAAWVMADRDLAKMDEGLMDPAGRGRTRGGRQCAVLGVVFSALCCGNCGFVFVVPWLSRM